MRCTYDPATRGGDAPDGRKVKATLHWVSAAHAVPAEVRLYDRLFTVENPSGQEEDFKDYLNPHSLEVLTGLPAGAEPGGRRTRRPVPVRAARVFLRGCRGFRAGTAGVQPDGDAEGRVGEDQEGGKCQKKCFMEEVLSMRVRYMSALERG